MKQTKRTYRLGERAKSQEQTRLRIVEAAVALHEELGPRATTISEIAKRAGVQRLTVYSHFPDDKTMFEACTSHWLALHPPPDPAGWQELADPVARFRAAIGAFYAYFSATRRMWTVAFRDVSEVPALRDAMANFVTAMEELARDLIAAFADPSDGTAATIRHALHFLTWSELESQGLDDKRKVDLVTRWLDGAGRD